MKRRRYLLQTGPSHPGRVMWVQKPGGPSAFRMTPERHDAQTYPSKAAAKRDSSRFSTLYGLHPVAADVSAPL